MESSPNPDDIFGVPLHKVMKRSTEKVIPTVVKKLLLYLNTERIIRAKDLFSIPAGEKSLLTAKKECNKTGDISLGHLSPSLAGALLRTYILDLPEPLLTYQSYVPMISAAGISENIELKNQKIRTQLSKLPPYNSALIKIMFLFLARAVEHHSLNKLTSKNLATIFRKGLLRSEIETTDIIEDSTKAAAIIQHMIENYEEIFKKTNHIKGKRKVASTAEQEQKMIQIVDAVDSAISLVQNKLARLRLELDATTSMEEAIVIARKIRAAKRVLSEASIGDTTGIKDSKGIKGKALEARCTATPEQLRAQLERSEKIASEANSRSVVSPTSGIEEQQGKRPSMEDAHAAVDNVLNDIEVTKEHAFYAVCDGHAGPEAAAVAGEHLMTCIFHKFSETATEEENLDALKEAFANTDEIVLSASAEGGWKSGTTVVIAVLSERTLYIANLGDSEAILAKRKHEGGYSADCISYKHKVTDTSEKERIRSLGGHVVFGRLFGDLAVSRALGDADYKRPISDADFVSNDPYVNCVKLSHTEDDFLILACDGIWDTVTYQESVNLVGFARDMGKTPTECSQMLVKQALDAGSKDNCTAIVIFFDWVNM